MDGTLQLPVCLSKTDSFCFIIHNSNTLILPFLLQPSYTPDYSMYTKPLTHVARSARPPSFFTPESLRQDLLARETVCLSVPVSGDTCPSDVEHYHSLCPLEPVDTTPPEQVRGLGTNRLVPKFGFERCMCSVT